MTDPVVIRYAGQDDYDRAHALMVETLEHHARTVPERFRETEEAPPARDFIADILAGGQGAFVLAEEGDAVIGFLTVRLNVPLLPFLRREVWGTVDTLGVRSDRRERGIGRLLMEEAQQWAATRGATRMFLTVWETNTAALAFYESLGYTTANRGLWRPLRDGPTGF